MTTDASLEFFRELRPLMGRLVSGDSGMSRAAEASLICQVLFARFLQESLRLDAHRLLPDSFKSNGMRGYDEATRQLFEHIPGAKAFPSFSAPGLRISSEQLYTLVIELIPRYRWGVARTESAEPDSVKPLVRPWLLGYIYERWINPRATASYFTPEALAYHIVSHALEEWLVVQYQQESDDAGSVAAALKCWRSQDYAAAGTLQNIFTWLADALLNIRIVDLSVGGGAFLAAAARVVCELVRFSCTVNGKPEPTTNLLARIFARNLYGIDVVREAIAIAKMRLWLLIGELELSAIPSAERLPPLDHILPGNSLAVFYLPSSHAQFSLFSDSPTPAEDGALSALLSEAGGFDLCVGNPPFIALSQKNHVPEKKDFIATWNAQNPAYLLHTTSDLSNFFILRGIQVLQPHGVLAYITSRNFFDTRYGEPLRRFLTKEVELRHIFTLHDHPFVQAGVKVKANTAIISLVRQAPTARLRFQHLVSWDQPLLHEAGRCVERAELYASQNWTQTLFEYDLAKALRARSSRQVSDYATARMGIKSGCNSFFLLRTDSDVFARVLARAPSKHLAPVVKNSRDIPGFVLPVASPYRLLNLYEKVAGIEHGILKLSTLDPIAQYVYQCGIQYSCPVCQALALEEDHIAPNLYPHRGMCEKCQKCRAAENRCDRPVDRLSTQGHHPEWYTLALTEPPQIAVQCVVDTEIGVFWNKAGIYVTDQFQVLHSSGSSEMDALVFLYLSSRIAHLLLEGMALHRARFDGSFMLKIQVEHLNQLPCPELSQIPAEKKQRLFQLLERLVKTENRKSEEAQNLKDEIDRVFLQILGYQSDETESVQRELRAALEKAILFRWEKTRSRNDRVNSKNGEA